MIHHPMKKIWWEYDKSLNSHLIPHLISAAKDYAGGLCSDMNQFYQKTKKYQKNYQHRTTGEKIDLMGKAGLESSVEQKFDVKDYPILTYNATRACCNTAHNKIAKITPKVTLLTKGGSRESIIFSQKIEKWIFKTFKKATIYKKAARAFLDAVVSGIGIIKIVKEKFGFDFYKVNSFDFFCNHSMSGAPEPDCAGEKKYLSIYELMQTFPSRANDLTMYYTDYSEKIMVWEMYKAKEKKIIFSEKFLFLYEDYEHDFLPYEFFKWSEATEGVISIGIAEELYFKQQYITFLVQKIANAVHKLATTTIFTQKGSHANKLTNVDGEIIELDMGEKPPVVAQPPPVNEAVMRILADFWDKCFEVTGLSKMDAYGTMPPGLQQASGAALRAYNQIDSERFQLVRENYEENFVSIAKKIMKMSTDAQLPKGLMRKDVNENLHKVTIFSSNILPETPSGRYAVLSDMMNTGFVSKEQAMSLLKSPDMDKFQSSESSRIDAIQKTIEEAIKEKRSPTYYPELGLEITFDSARKYFAKFLLEDDEDKLALLRPFIAELEEKVNAQAQLNQIPTENPTMNGAGGSRSPQQFSQVTPPTR